jgi:octaprenyl-diphosphate synthase
VHDDVIDSAATRRGRPSANARFGNNLTVLYGDHMFAKAMQMALRAGSLRVMDELAAATLRMTEGEMLQTSYVGRLDLSVEEYLDLIDKKTASLFACCCELAGLLADAGEARNAALRRYGRHLGLVFQLVDDLLDLTGEAERLGKPAASDLREGKATLAVLDLLSNGPGEARLVRRIMEDEGADAREVARLRASLHESGAIARTLARAREHAEGAVGELAAFPVGPARLALEALPDLLLARDR